MPKRAELRFLLFGLSLFVVCGCSSPKVVETQLPIAQERLLKLGQAYGQYCTQHKKPPAKPADLKAILGDADAFISPDDGQPFHICWGIDFGKPANPPLVVAYEKNGRDGRRYVLTTARNVLHMVEPEFRTANFPPGHHPQ